MHTCFVAACVGQALNNKKKRKKKKKKKVPKGNTGDQARDQDEGDKGAAAEPQLAPPEPSKRETAEGKTQATAQKAGKTAKKKKRRKVHPEVEL